MIFGLSLISTLFFSGLLGNRVGKYYLKLLKQKYITCL